MCRIWKKIIISETYNIPTNIKDSWTIHMNCIAKMWRKNTNVVMVAKTFRKSKIPRINSGNRRHELVAGQKKGNPEINTSSKLLVVFFSVKIMHYRS